MLDFGGSLDSTYLQNWARIRQFRDLDWGIIEQAHYVEVKKRIFRCRAFPHHVSTEDARSDFTLRLEVFGGLLQYLEHPMAKLPAVASHTRKALLLGGLPLTDEEVWLSNKSF